MKTWELVRKESCLLQEEEKHADPECGDKTVQAPAGLPALPPPRGGRHLPLSIWPSGSSSMGTMVSALRNGSVTLASQVTSSAPICTTENVYSLQLNWGFQEKARAKGGHRWGHWSPHPPCTYRAVASSFSPPKSFSPFSSLQMLSL